MSVDSRRRVQVDRREFVNYRTKCPFCEEAVGPRFVTREHLDVPPAPPYAASVRCPRCREQYEAVFSDSN